MPTHMEAIKRRLKKEDATLPIDERIQQSADAPYIGQAAPSTTTELQEAKLKALEKRLPQPGEPEFVGPLDYKGKGRPDYWKEDEPRMEKPKRSILDTYEGDEVDYSMAPVKDLLSRFAPAGKLIKSGVKKTAETISKGAKKFGKAIDSIEGPSTESLIDFYQKVILPSAAIAESIGTGGKSKGEAAINQMNIIENWRTLGKQKKLLKGMEYPEDIAYYPDAAEKILYEKYKYGKEEATADEIAKNTEILSGLLDKSGKRIYTDEEVAQIAPYKTVVQKAVASAAGLQEKSLEDIVGRAVALGKVPSKIPSSEIKNITDKQESVSQLDELMKTAKNLELWWSPADKLRAYNPYDTKAQSFQQLVAATKQVIGKGLEGGVLRKEDEEKYEKIIPKLGDTKEVLESKATQLRQMLVRGHNSLIDNFKIGGYITEGFNRIEDINYNKTLSDSKKGKKRILTENKKIEIIKKLGPNATDEQIIKAIDEAERR